MALNDNDGVTYGSGSVFKDLNIVLTREQWAKLCAENESKRPYLFADVVKFPTKPADLSELL